ncbi:hypothetical protein [Stenotrophomonas sp. MMGLT7]|uniref:hypothetical protein n=1 Tax=Stenotrophomonas sp. MMGLT7 TaxID=2901227 RepID=UPI001E39F12D|nr:hypothetical protein [Stenotrophomonas sp. MMGLT7]MCD7100118.1 hypothetical protein [Stenotrophomonas sp. MMGLT7]
MKGCIVSTLRRLAGTCLGLALCAAAYAQAPADLLAVPGPLQFGGERFHLAWSGHPWPGYYKQEYVPAGQPVERFHAMLLLDLALGDADPARQLQAKVRELEQRKAFDPHVTYEIRQQGNDGDGLLDFVLSAPAADGSVIVEWNAYRYVRRPDGVLLLGISRRGYGDGEVRDLAAGLPRARLRDLAALARWPLPAVEVPAGGD